MKKNMPPQEGVAPHIKHADIPRPNYGNFHRNEWAILGAPCEIIRNLAFALTEALSPQFRIAYADADHQGSKAESGIANPNSTMLAQGAKVEYTDKIGFHRFDRASQPDYFQFRAMFAEQDLVLLNGNHFPGKQQIVIIDPKKEASLQRKITGLSQVSLILLAEGQTGPYPFLLEHLAQTGQAPPILNLRNLSDISNWLRGEMHKAAPPLYGLVLAGGKSTRMGTDKSLIDYHGVPQKDFAAQLLGKICEKVYVSIRHDQEPDIQSPFPHLSDTFLHLGPMGALLSAFRAHPDAAWLAIACDLPLLDSATIEHLAEQRRSSALATAFTSPVNGFPEPLVAIWEPRSYPVLLQFLSQGYSCPRKVLLNTEVHLLQPPSPDALANVNFPSEMEAIQKILNRKT